MRNKYFFIILFVPILEIVTFISLADKFNTIGIILSILITTMAGIFILRRQGIAFMRYVKMGLKGDANFKNSFSSNFILFFSGIFLIVPGFITDAIGFILIILWLINYMKNVNKENIKTDAFNVDGPVIDGDFENLTDKNEI
mgnify:FL=1